MACKRSAVRSRYPPPRSRSLSSRGLGHDPFTVGTGVRIPVGTPISKPVRLAPVGLLVFMCGAVRTNMDVMAALNEAFDTVRRSVKEEAEKRRNH